MSYGLKFSGYKRTNWSKKNDKEQQKLLIKHFQNLDIEPPKYISSEKITKSQIKQARNRIEKEYQKNVRIEKEYNSARKVYNQKIDRIKEKVLKGRSWLEQQYILGEEIFMQQIHSEARMIHADKLTLTKLHDEQFNNISSMKERTKVIRRELKKLSKIKDSDFYNTTHNDKMLKYALDRLDYFGADTVRTINYNQMYNSLSSFEKELSMKSIMEEIIDRYLGEHAPELDEHREDLFFKHVERILYNVKRLVPLANEENIHTII